MNQTKMIQDERNHAEYYLRLSAASAELACLKLEITKLKEEKAELIVKLADASNDNSHLSRLARQQAIKLDNLCFLLASK